MTRRDRAALVLAYECLREPYAACVDALGDAIDALPSWDMRRTIRRVWEEAGYTRAMAHVLRARLALYLRARLRAEAGDFGPVAAAASWPPCATCSGPARPVWHRWMPPGYRITPLWQQAGARRTWLRCPACAWLSPLDVGMAPRCPECSGPLNACSGTAAERRQQAGKAGAR